MHPVKIPDGDSAAAQRRVVEIQIADEFHRINFRGARMRLAIYV
jgi:hypothetical protein